MTFAAVVVALAWAAPISPNPDVVRGFDHFFNLEFDQAIATFQDLVRRRPDAADFHNHLAQSILYRQMLKAGALETELVTGGNAFLRRQKMNPTEEEQGQFDGAVAAAMQLTAGRLQQNPSDTEALYMQGVAYGLRANYNFLVRKAWLDALRDATQSRKLHNRVSELDPANIDARLTQGVHDYIVGSLPWTYRMLSFLTGFRSDRERGIHTVEEVYRKGTRNRVDAAVLLATVYRRERRPSLAVPLLEGLIREFPRNYLFLLELAQMFSDLGQKEKALSAVAEVERLKRAGSPGYAHLPMEKVLYFRATIQFWYNDLDAALANFQRVVEHADSLDPNTGVTAWMRLGQSHDLRGNRVKAVDAYRRAIAYAPGSYRAEECERYLRRPYTRSMEPRG